MSEHDEQVLLFKWAKLAQGKWPELGLLYAIPNGGFRHKATAARLKAEGVQAGCPDICLPVARGGYHGLYVELKHLDNTAQDNQKEWLEALSAQGYMAVVAYEFEGARHVIEGYLALPPTVPTTYDELDRL